MNREHVVGCPALRAGVRCTCQIVPSSRVEPNRVEEIRRWHEDPGHKAAFPTCETCKVVTALTAENERLREHVGASGIAYAEALRKRAEQAEAENERLRAEVTFFDGQHAAAMETVGELSDRVEHAEARTRALVVALDEKIRLHDQCCGCRPPTFCECFGIADMLDLRAALTEPTPPQEEK